MKNLIALLALVAAASNVKAETINITTVKVADGKIAHCRNMNDFNRNKIGAYRLNGVSADLEGGKLNIKGEINFLACTKSEEGKFTFVNVGPYHTFSYPVFINRNNISTVDVATERVILRSYVDGKYNKVDTHMGRNAGSNVEISMDLEEALSAEQMIDLSEGKSVKASVDSFVLKTILITNQDGVSLRDQRAFGSFRFHVEITNEEGVFKARIIK